MSNPSKRQILVVDDNAGVRETFSMLLVSTGYEVAVAEDGIAALAQLKEAVPDVIVSDLEMPRMSGFELLSVVRRRFPQILTVAMSGAYPDDQLPASVIADAFCAKGQHPRNLFSTIERLIASGPDRWTAHEREAVPAWIPRNGHDSYGVPYVMLTCEDCLRVFQLEVAEETTGKVIEIPCRFCPNTNSYIIEPAGDAVQQAIA
jgi:CheY-like chemotaxis protein